MGTKKKRSRNLLRDKVIKELIRGPKKFEEEDEVPTLSDREIDDLLRDLNDFYD